ncbi:MAG TPA: TIGR01777 family oxidoreductase [Thermoanaerobaculia bacterium]|nr:TIGR01777 family oxidoreductase [Thermoanaerobaculia bacterium]
MKIAIAGGSGFIGEPLTRRLVARGDDVAVLSRNPAKVEAGRGLAWDPTKPDGAWADEVANADAVINLAGENIGDRRWTEERKRRMIASRLDSTSALVAAMRCNPSKKRTIISASAVGYYGNRGDETLDEHSSRGEGFLAELVEQWESAAREAEPLGRLVIPRFGVVLARDGGALKKMWLPFKLGVGGPIGNGKQWMAWIDRDDAIRAVEWALDNENVRGVYNVTAPEPVRARDFARTLGRVMHRPALIPVPAFALRIAFGQMADEALLAGQRAIPSHAIAEGFAFTYPTIEASLARQG